MGRARLSFSISSPDRFNPPARIPCSIIATTLTRLFLFALLSLCHVASAQDIPTGTINGRVTDAETLETLVGVNVLIEGIGRGAATDLDGDFQIEGIPVGSYTVTVSYIGFETVRRTDVIVRSGRITFLDIALRAASVEVEGVTVTAGYFPESIDQPVSVTGMSAEEIRRAPGTAGDVSRVVFALPSVAKADDSKNSLIVRGGGPTENGFYIDNIEISNINHFPEQGSSGGPIGMVHVDFIRNVDFHAGGFGTEYGDRLSAIMDIDFRRGNTQERDIQLDMNFAGFGAVVEGPLGTMDGSYLFSARRSFLDLIVKAIDETETSIPEYSDIQGKVDLRLARNHRLSVLGIMATDVSNLEGEDAIENEENLYNDFFYRTHTVGANWLAIWGSRAHSETSISQTRNRYDYQLFQTVDFIRDGSHTALMDLQPTESEWRLRNVNRLILSDAHRLSTGIEVKVGHASYRNFYGAWRDELGQETNAFRVDDDIDATKVFAFASHTWSPGSRFSLTGGARIGHYSLAGSTTISPRMSARYRLTSTVSVSAAAGVFRQYLPLPLIAQNTGNRDLRSLRSDHFIIGLQKQLSESTRLTLEAYAKEYRNFPMDPSQPETFVLDQVVALSVFVNDEPLVDSGRARTRGLELMLQKKLASNVYGLVSASAFRARYRDLNGTWRNRIFDNRVTFQAEGGYKPNAKWEFSARWLYGGGRPFTPFDLAASEAAGRGIADQSRILSERLPAYHSFNVRFDRRFNWTRQNLIVYISIWNAYDRINISTWEWNEVTNEPDPLEQWGLLPIFGVEWEF